MAELKTKKTTASVAKFINDIKDSQQRADAKVLHKLFLAATGEKPAMWGTAIIGYGTCFYGRDIPRPLRPSQRLFGHRSGDVPRAPISPKFIASVSLIGLHYGCGEPAVG